MLRFMLGALIGTASICACTTYDSPPVSTASPIVQTPAGVYALGTGVVESVSLLPPPRLGERASASAGGSIPPHAAYRLGIRMADGRLQVIDQESQDFQVGDRVRITGSGRVIRM
jgi:hypothetical protein